MSQLASPGCDLAKPEWRGVKVKERALRICRDRKSTRLNSSHSQISYAVFCLKKKNIRALRSAIAGDSLVHRALVSPPLELAVPGPTCDSAGWSITLTMGRPSHADDQLRTDSA